MDTCFGFVGKDYVLLAADGTAARGIMVFKTTEDKILELNATKAMAMAGPQGDRSHFGEYIQKNLHLYELRHSLPMTTNALANYTRDELAKALRRGPYEVNLLLGGYDEGKGPSLYYIDYMGAMQKMNFGVHGHASNFTLSVFDRYWKQDMTLEEGKEVLKKCLQALNERFLLSLPSWKIKVITKDGTSEISLSDDAKSTTSSAAPAKE